MARTTHVKSAQQRYEMVPVLDDEGKQKVVPVMTKRRDEDGNLIQKVTKKGRPVFKRLTVADKSKPLPMPKCEKCGTTIEVGQPYKHVSPKSGPYGGRTRYRCGTCPGWFHWELSSSKMAEIWQAEHEVGKELAVAESVEDLEALRDQFAEAVRSVAEQYNESADNIEDGFGHEVPASEELRQKAEELEAWADDIEGIDFEDFDESDVEADEDDDDSEADLEDKVAEAMEEHWEEQRSKLEDEMGNCPV